MSGSPKPFEFVNEFTPDGQMLTGDAPAYKPVETVEQEVQQARAETQAAVMTSVDARTAASLEAVLSQLKPAQDVIAAISASLRNEAIELAMAAANTIAGIALEKHGAEAAAESVASVVSELKAAPYLVVSIPPESAPAIAQRLQSMPDVTNKIRFEANPNAQPGDWRIEFSDGAITFDRNTVTQSIEEALNRRQNDPVEDQLDLFGVGAA